jgi:hypothetical protein
MKHPYIRIVSVLLAVIIAFGLMPTVSFAGGDVDLEYANIHVVYPVAGQHPNTIGIPSDSLDSKYYTIDYCYYYNDDGMGRVVFDEETFVGGETYKVQIHLYAKEGYDFSTSTRVTINGRVADLDYFSYDECYYSVSMTAASETVKVTMDPNGFGLEPFELQVPKGATIWDVIRNFDIVREPDQPYDLFLNWSLDPFGTSYDDSFPFGNPVESDMTLYAMWRHCQDSVELYVEVPANCLHSDVGKADIIIPSRADYSVESDFFYAGLVDGYLHPDLIYCMPFQKGATYYSRATVYLDVAASLPEVHLYGGKVISVTKIQDYAVDILYTVTAPSGDSLNQAGVFIETPRAGQNAMSYHPTATSLTPGVEMSTWGWYTSSDLSGDWYEGNLVGGNTYYALVRIYGSDNYNLNYSKLRLFVYGKNVKLVRMVDLASLEGVPNLVGAVVAVTIPKAYTFTVEVPYGGGKFRTDRKSTQWVTIMDFGGVEEGPITLEAKADPEHLFNMWYDGWTFETLSKEEKYTFNLDHNVYIKTSFVTKPPFVDVGAHDYFYEPVMWAIDHDPVITSGVNKTHFGPDKDCTREQIVTFLWKACYAPMPMTTTNPFPKDVDPTQYYYKPILWAVENGITSGVGKGKFGVGQSCTRAQAMTFLWKSYGSPEPKSTSCQFVDVDPTQYYYKAILWAVENGVTKGVSKTKFGVNQTCTRAQIITFLYKVYGPKG